MPMIVYIHITYYQACLPTGGTHELLNTFMKVCMKLFIPWTYLHETSHKLSAAKILSFVFYRFPKLNPSVIKIGYENLL